MRFALSLGLILLCGCGRTPRDGEILMPGQVNQEYQGEGTPLPAPLDVVFSPDPKTPGDMSEVSSREKRTEPLSKREIRRFIERFEHCP